MNAAYALCFKAVEKNRRNGCQKYGEGMKNFAVIGVGRMGGVHAANLKRGRVRGARLECICDLKDEAVAAFIKKNGEVKHYRDYKEMLAAEKLDAVIIATEHYYHVEIAEYCLEHGVSVLVEKPLAVTTGEAKKLIACAAGKPKLTAAVMFNQRTNPLYRRAHNLIKSGALGKIQRVNYIITDWYRSQAYYDQGGWRGTLWGEGGGTLINQCIHQLDLIQWITGMPERVDVKMFTKGRNITTENDVTALFEYGDDVFCAFQASTHELRGTNRMEIACEKGRIVVDGFKMKVYIFKKDEPSVNASTKSGYGFVTRKTKRYYHALGFAVGFLRGGQQLNIVKNFAAALDGKEKLISPVADGLNAVEMINGMYLSGWNGKRVELPVDDDVYAAELKKRIELEKQINRRDI